MVIPHSMVELVVAAYAVCAYVFACVGVCACRFVCVIHVTIKAPLCNLSYAYNATYDSSQKIQLNYFMTKYMYVYYICICIDMYTYTYTYIHIYMYAYICV